MEKILVCMLLLVVASTMYHSVAAIDKCIKHDPITVDEANMPANFTSYPCGENRPDPNKDTLPTGTTEADTTTSTAADTGRRRRAPTTGCFTKYIGADEKVSRGCSEATEAVACEKKAKKEDQECVCTDKDNCNADHKIEFTDGDGAAGLTPSYFLIVSTSVFVMTFVGGGFSLQFW